MPSNQTPNYQLSQWERTDRVLMDDFNSDNAKIDEALGTLAAASASHTAALAQKGNCQLYFTTCTADGTYRMSLYFPHKPLFVFLVGPTAETLFAAQGIRRGLVLNGVTGSADTAWSGNSLTLSNMSYIGMKGDTMTVIALLDAAQ